MRIYLTFISLMSLFASCSSHSPSKGKELTDNESLLFDSLKISKKVALSIRDYSDSTFYQFKFDQHYLNLDSSNKVQTVTTTLPGILFRAKPKQADKIIRSLRNELEGEGYIIFLSDNNFGIDNQPNEVGVVRAKDQFEILKYRQTNGINYDIDNDSLITLMKSFHRKYDLKLIGAGLDWCEFIIQKEPESWLVLAKEAYKVCPDIVDQGTETVEALANEMRTTKRLYFWWD